MKKYLIIIGIATIILTSFLAYTSEASDLIVATSYPESNFVGNLSLGGDGTPIFPLYFETFTVGQDVNVTKATFYLRKVGSPTGNATAYIYTTTGSCGTTGKPTGTALVTSNSVDISTLTTTNQLLDFTFSDQIILRSGVCYALEIRYSGGNGSDYLGIGIDNSPSYSGNFGWKESLGGSYVSYTSYDLIFYVYGNTLDGEQFNAKAGDGYVENTSDTGTWQDTRDATTGTGVNYTDVNAFGGTRNLVLLGNRYGTRRVFLPFDTSGIPTNATITSAKLYFYVTTVINSPDDYDYIGVVQTSQANSATLSNSDFDNVASVLGASPYDLAVASTTQGQYNSITLNATGTAWITKSNQTSNCGTQTGVTCLGLREGHDIENVDPNGFHYFTIATSEDTSGVKGPFLMITYTVPPPANSDVVITNTLKVYNNLSIK